MVKKVVNAKAKSAFQPCFGIKKIDQNYSWSNQSTNSTIVKSQSSTMKDPQSKELQVQGIELSSSPQHFKSSKKVWKKKKKEQCRKDQKHRKSSIPANGVNAAQTGEPYQKKKTSKNVEIETWVRLYISTMTKKVIMPILIPINQKTSFSLGGDLFVSDWD